MLRLLRFLWTGDWHLHQWAIVETTECEDTARTSRWTRRYAKCKHCGIIKVFDPS